MKKKTLSIVAEDLMAIAKQVNSGEIDNIIVLYDKKDTSEKYVLSKSDKKTAIYLMEVHKNHLLTHNATYEIIDKQS